MDIHHFLAQQREKATEFLQKENAQAEQGNFVGRNAPALFQQNLGERERDRRRGTERDRRDRRDDHREWRSRRDDYEDRGRDRYSSSSSHHERRNNDDDRGRTDRPYRSDDHRNNADFERRHEADGERWINAEPSQTILLRGLPPHIDETQIRAALTTFQAAIKDVRLMKRKDTGASRGFAFVEFQKIADAQQWMELNQGQMDLGNEYRVNMYYSQPRDPEKTQDWTRSDWTCTRCGVHNFKRRDSCFKCQLSKDESDKLKDEEGTDQIGNNPCNTLLLRGLDALTTEEGVRNSLGLTTALPVKNVIVMRDSASGASRGFGFVEMESITSSTQLLDTLTRKGYTFEVDGKAIIVSYAKNTLSTVLATQQPIGAAAHGTQPSILPLPPDVSQLQYASATSLLLDASGQPLLDPRTGQPMVQPLVSAMAPLVAMQALPIVTMPTVPQLPQQQLLVQQLAPLPTTTTTTSSALPQDIGKPLNRAARRTLNRNQKDTDMQSDITNSAAAVAQAAIEQAHASKLIHQKLTEQQRLATMTVEERIQYQAALQLTSQTGSEPPHGDIARVVSSTNDTVTLADGSTYKKYPTPDVSSYQFDESSGYHYDSLTGLYYDSKSQYYYNSQTQKYLYWSPEHQTFLPAPSDPHDESGDKNSEDGKRKDRDKKDKVKIAKKIAKDMEKWAKSQNAAKEAVTGVRKTMGEQNEDLRSEMLSADAGYAILEKKKMDLAFLTQSDNGAAANQEEELQKAAGLVASYGGDSDGESDHDDQPTAEEEERKLIDFNKMACLLCKRQFNSQDMLLKHQQLSELHKTNLAKHMGNKQSGPSSVEQAQNIAIQYRDRAKERRDKFGAPPPPAPRKRKAELSIPYEQPNNKQIQDDNVGNRLMQKMGWTAGQGLGRAGQGRVDPVEAKRRNATAGLGATGASYDLDATDSYKDSARKAMYARYKELEDM